MHEQQSFAPVRELTYPEIDQVYKALFRMKESLGPSPNRRHRAEILIGVCILHQFNSRYLIDKGTRVMGLSHNNVMRALDERTGAVPGKHLWQCDADGYYQMLDAD